MTKSIIKTTLLGLLTASLLGLPASAKDTNAPATDKKPVKAAKAKRSTTSTHGKLKALDKVAKTIVIGEHTLQITPDTAITKFGKPATLDDGVVGEEVSASYQKTDGDKLSATKVRFGPKTETPAAHEKKASKMEN
ncbi:MAG: hypothetical protein U1F65_06390 [Verrucomicrobiota bacterium]